MIAGLYGMNFDRMPELHASFGYPATLLAIVVLCASLYRWFRRHEWL